MLYRLVKISDITHPMKNLQIAGKIEDKKPQPSPFRRHHTAYLCDDTGKILLNLWRDQVDQVKDGDTIYLLGAFTKKEKFGVTLSTWEEKIHKKKPIVFGK